MSKQKAKYAIKVDGIVEVKGRGFEPVTQEYFLKLLEENLSKGKKLVATYERVADSPEDLIGKPQD